MTIWSRTMSNPETPEYPLGATVWALLEAEAPLDCAAAGCPACAGTGALLGADGITHKCFECWGEGHLNVTTYYEPVRALVVGVTREERLVDVLPADFPLNDWTYNWGVERPLRYLVYSPGSIVEVNPKDLFSTEDAATAEVQRRIQQDLDERVAAARIPYVKPETPEKKTPAE